MSQVSTRIRDDLVEVEETYRRLSALDPGRPGEWVRRKVQAYAAQQNAERAVRENTKVVDKPSPSASPAALAPKVALRATAAAAEPAAKKPFGIPVILGGIGLVVLAIFLVVPRFMATHDASAVVPPPPPPVPLAPPAETTSRVAQSPTPSEPPAESPPAALQSSEPEATSTATPEPELPPVTAPAKDATLRPSAPPLAPDASTAKPNTAPRARPQPKAPVAAHQGAPAAAKPGPVVAHQSASVAAKHVPIASNTRSQASPAAPSINNAATATSAQAGSAPTTPTSSPPPQAAPAVASTVATPPPEFYQAAQSGDLKTLQAGFDGSTNVNARDPKGHTALILAIQHGQTDAVKALLTHGASATFPDAHGTTPMGAAHDRGNFEISEMVEHATRH